MKLEGYIFGIPIYTSEYLPKEYEHRQRRTHWRSRINKKWRKKYGFVSIPIEKAYMINTDYLKLDFKPTFIINELYKDEVFKNSVLKYFNIYG